MTFMENIDTKTRDELIAYIDRLRHLEFVKDNIIREQRGTIERLIAENTKMYNSFNGSSIAKGGYIEESLVCNDINCNAYNIRHILERISGHSIGICTRVQGHTKVDIHDTLHFNAQIKKCKYKQFQQLGRYGVNTLVHNVPNLFIIEYILKGLCELPINDLGKVCRDIPRKSLSAQYYTLSELELLINTLEHNKRDLLQFMFYGDLDITRRPTYIIGVYYIDATRVSIKIYNIQNMIDELMSYYFTITNSKNVISLGGNKITIQRKGGDNGRPSSNQIQFKITLSSFIHEHEINLLS